MAAEDYRSYVIRVRRRPAGRADQPRATRLDIEDLLAGGTATVSGETASAFADSLERLVATRLEPPAAGPSEPATSAATPMDPAAPA